MSTLAEFMIVASVDNGPPMLDKPQYESWKSHMELYIQEDDTVRLKTYEELSDKKKIQADCDLKATNIVLQGLPPDIYALVNHHKIAKDIRDKVKLLMQGTSLLRQEHECKLYDEFDKFFYVKGETLLLPEWGKFMTDVKLARDLHTSNYDQLYAYLEQHEAHANEALLMLGLKDFMMILKLLLLRYFSFGRHLEELHMTWAHLEKKRTRLRTYTNIDQEFLYIG
ncbi:hypothetical protein Tco_1149470, partial [Tanacetum coccineum]